MIAVILPPASNREQKAETGSYHHSRFFFFFFLSVARGIPPQRKPQTATMSINTHISPPPITQPTNQQPHSTKSHTSLHYHHQVYHIYNTSHPKPKTNPTLITITTQQNKESIKPSQQANISRNITIGPRTFTRSFIRIIR